MQVEIVPELEPQLQRLAKDGANNGKVIRGSLVFARIEAGYSVLHAFSPSATELQHQLHGFPFQTGQQSGL